MFQSLSAFVALRYTRTKKRTGFISFISAASMVGIVLGVTVLIVVLSVMNGFNYQIKSRFFSVAPELTVFLPPSNLPAWQKFGEKYLNMPVVSGYAPFVSGKGMLSHAGAVAAASVLGIDPVQESEVSALGKKMTQGKLTSLTPGSFHILVGVGLAKSLDLFLGSSVVLLTPSISNTPFGLMPRYKTFTVSGIFKVGTGFGFDDSVAYINMNDAQKLYAGAHFSTGIHVHLHDLYAAPTLTNLLQTKLPFLDLVSNWTLNYGAFFHALSMEKTMMFVILLLIVAVAAFNLVSTLMMLVNDKQSEIAILRTIGLSRFSVMKIFILQGALVALIGIVLGGVAGVILALNATSIVNEIQHIFHVHFISSSVYFVNYLPSKLEWLDVFWILLMAFVMCVLATLYPAWRAASVQPAEALTYD